MWMFTYVFSHSCPSPHSGFDEEAGERWWKVGDRILALRQMAA